MAKEKSNALTVDALFDAINSVQPVSRYSNDEDAESSEVERLQEDLDKAEKEWEKFREGVLYQRLERAVKARQQALSAQKSKEVKSRQKEMRVIKNRVRLEGATPAVIEEVKKFVAKWQSK